MKVIAMIPAYNSGKTLERTLQAIPAGSTDEILVVDDGSKDDSVAIARRLGATVVLHEKNKGYGAAQKTGYREALLRGADVIVMVHADFQYDPTLVPAIVKPVAEGTADACFGSRMYHKRDALKGGMPLWRFIPNIVLTWVEDAVFRLHLSEYHTGYRAYSRRALERIPFEKNSDNYVFDTEMFAELALGHFRTAEIPIPTRYFADAHSPNFRKSVQYGLSTLWVVCQYLLHRMGIKKYPQFVIRSEK